MAVIVKQAFKTSRNGVFLEFPEGHLVRDADLATFLLEGKMPVEEVKDSEMVVCPHCRKAFSVPKVESSDLVDLQDQLDEAKKEIAFLEEKLEAKG